MDCFRCVFHYRLVCVNDNLMLTSQDPLLSRIKTECYVVGITHCSFCYGFADQWTRPTCIATSMHSAGGIWRFMWILFMATLRSRCGHYIFALWFLLLFSFFFFFFFPRLISAVADLMSTVLPHMMWPYRLSANLECMSEMCCTLSLIHIWRCRRSYACRSRWSPYH